MLNVESIIQSGGLLLIGFILFAETGLLVGFFLPGDTLLFAAGAFAAQGKLPIVLLLITVLIGAIAGNTVGYEIGFRAGPKIFKRKEGLLDQSYIEKAELFYKKHGGKTIILARFVPIIRTLVPVLAGVARMPRKLFALYNIIGALCWGVSVTVLGYWFGSKIPNIDHYLLPVILFASLLTFGPTLFHLVKEPRSRKYILGKLRHLGRVVTFRKK